MFQPAQLAQEIEQVIERLDAAKMRALNPEWITDAERKACEISLRAEIRTGELLKELAKFTPTEAGAIGAMPRPET